MTTSLVPAACFQSNLLSSALVEPGDPARNIAAPRDAATNAYLGERILIFSSNLTQNLFLSRAIHPRGDNAPLAFTDMGKTSGLPKKTVCGLPRWRVPIIVLVGAIFCLDFVLMESI